MEMEGVIAIILVVVAFFYASRSIRILRPYEKGLIERLGRYTKTADSGLTILFPFETIRKVDMREQVIEVPPQEVITKDNVVVTVDAVIYFHVTDPFKVVYNVAKFGVGGPETGPNQSSQHHRRVGFGRDLEQPRENQHPAPGNPRRGHG